MKYAVNEVYSTIQGEGSFTGTPAVFLRLQGCAVGCGWCDTKPSWEQDEWNRVDTIGQATVGEHQKWTYASIDSILTAIQREAGPSITHVVVTGGEPFEQDIGQLINALQDEGFFVQIETSGTAPIPADIISRMIVANGTSNPFITVSPKIGMPGNLVMIPEVVEAANEIKMPVGKQRDIDKLKDLLDQCDVPRETPVYLQPLSQSAKATDLCIDQAMQNGWKVSIQVHKYIGVA